jgi:hypothetical protein
MKKIFHIILTLLLIQQTNAQSFEILKATELKAGMYENTYLYALPKTSIIFKITTNKATFIPGPYCNYAEEFLGITSSRTTENTECTIDSISVETTQESDNENYYGIKVSKPLQIEQLNQLEQLGLYFYPQSSTIHNPNISNPVNKNTLVKGFNEVTMKTFYNETADTIYKTILKDSAFIQVPIVRPKTETKTTKEKAKEASEVIMKLRQSRYEIILSEDNALPDAKSLKAVLGEMNDLEKKYTELFTGKTYNEKYVAYFVMSPTSKLNESDLFYFSSINGITEKTDSSAIPIQISFEKNNNSQVFENWTNNLPKQNHIFYRIPEVATLLIKKGEQTIASSRISIYQSGAIVSCPFEFKKK